MTLAGQIPTAGEFATEEEAWVHFDTWLERSGAFRSYPEVEGEYIQPRVATNDMDARIDRILIPKQPLLDAGWIDGPIGVEGKKSGKKIGPLISQAIDYSRCVWSPKPPPGLLLLVNWVFVYPVERVGGDIESIMSQNRIGYVSVGPTKLVFGCGGYHGITIHDDGRIEAKTLPMGRKRGSR